MGTTLFLFPKIFRERFFKFFVKPPPSKPPGNQNFLGPFPPKTRNFPRLKRSGPPKGILGQNLMGATGDPMGAKPGKFQTPVYKFFQPPKKLRLVGGFLPRRPRKNFFPPQKILFTEPPNLNKKFLFFTKNFVCPKNLFSFFFGKFFFSKKKFVF